MFNKVVAFFAKTEIKYQEIYRLHEKDIPVQAVCKAMEVSRSGNYPDVGLRRVDQ